MLRANYSTLKSLPSHTITWYINSQAVQNGVSAKTELLTSSGKDRLLYTRKQLMVRISRGHFKVRQILHRSSQPHKKQEHIESSF